MFRVRFEEPDDTAAVHVLVREAFEQSELGHHGEVELVDVLRAAYDNRISLVAVDEGVVIGHLMSSPASLELLHGVIRGTAIGPVSVLPKWQGRRVGSELITALIAIAETRGDRFVAVAGHPTYYPRFGFRVISDFGIRHCFRGMLDEHFFIRFLVDFDKSTTQGGLLKYCAEFGTQDRGAI